jgi:hypothetical protein
MLRSFPLKLAVDRRREGEEMVVVRHRRRIAESDISGWMGYSLTSGEADGGPSLPQ